MNNTVKHELVPIAKELYAVYTHKQTGEYLSLPIIGVYITYLDNQVRAVAVEIDKYGNVCRVGQREDYTLQIATHKVGLCSGI